MDLIVSLGINKTLFIQLGLFLIVFFFLRFYVFSAYYKAFEEREKRTVGSEDYAQELQQQIAEFEMQYQNKARQTHQQIGAVFQQKRSEAQAEYDKTVADARKKAQDSIEENRTRLNKLIMSVSADLKNQTNQVALSITNKLLGK